MEEERDGTLQDGVIHAIYDAAYAPEAMSRALDLVKRETQLWGAIIFAHGLGGNEQYQRSLACSQYQSLAPLMQEFNQRFVDGSDRDIDTIALMRAHHHPVGEILEQSMLFDMEGYDDLPQVRFIREKAGMGPRVAVNISHDPALLTSAIFNYDVTHDVAPVQDYGVLRNSAFHMGKAMEIIRWGEGLRAKYNAVLGVLNKIDLGVAIADPEGRIIVANTYADQILSGKEGLRLTRDDRLACQNPDLTAQLNTAILDIGKTARGHSGPNSFEFTVDRGSSTSPLAVMCSPLRDANMEIERYLTGALITIVDTGIRPRFQAQLFAQTYGLTPAEARIAPKIIEGLTTPQIAEDLGVALSTATSHVKSVLAKTACQNRVSLVWRATQFSPPIL